MKLNNYNEMNYTSSNIEANIKKLVDESTGVYSFRRLNHFKEKTDLIKWMEKQPCKLFDSFLVEYEEWDDKYTIESSDNSKIYYLEFDSKNKKEFLELFKVSINMLETISDCNIKENDFFTNDGINDQFDFIFVRNENVILITNIHPFVFVYDEKVLCKK